MAASKKPSLRPEGQIDLFQSVPVVADSPQEIVVKNEVPKEEIIPAKAAVIEARIYSVSDLAEELRESMQEHFGRVLVRGEITDFRGVHRSGHLYCSLKDDKSQIRLVMWRASCEKLKFDLEMGLEVIVTGKIDFYPGSGSLQIVADNIEPVGVGALQLKFEQLKEKLKKEGLFAAERKRPISALNWRIGIVTGRSTAALQDMLRIFSQRFPLVEVFLFHAAVQGDSAPREIIGAIESANRYSEKSLKPLDVLIVGRGGGSFEDLFCFNDEALARAIAKSKLPIVSVVGHEIDFTIADFVADKRSATPSHAAQETVPEALLWLKKLEELLERFERRMLLMISDQEQKLDSFHNRIIAAAPQKKLQHQMDLLKGFEQQLRFLMRAGLENRMSQMRQFSSVLEALSPKKVMERGYAVIRGIKQEVLKSKADIEKARELTIEMHDGSIAATLKTS